MQLGWFHWTPTASYLNIFRTLENRAKCFCISSEMQCVTKIHDIVDCTCLVYCLDDPKHFFLRLFRKTAKLLVCEEQFFLGTIYILLGYGDMV